MLFLSHLLVAYFVLVAPWLGRMLYQRARRRIACGDPNAKIRIYRATVAEQAITTILVLVLWASGQFSAKSLGLAAPRRWGWNLAALSVVLGALAWSSLRLRPKAEKIRRKMQDGIGALLPEWPRERVWWGAVSIGAGISEELVCRGFLFCYFRLYLPQLNNLELAFLTSLIFGFAHLYQGWQGAVSAGIMGLVFAGIYLLTGSLLTPVIIHAALDYRALLIFPPKPATLTFAEGNA
jgi:membrane protease YdiL (CAAX protease family)